MAAVCVYNFGVYRLRNKSAMNYITYGYACYCITSSVGSCARGDERESFRWGVINVIHREAIEISL